MYFRILHTVSRITNANSGYALKDEFSYGLGRGELQEQRGKSNFHFLLYLWNQTGKKTHTSLCWLW